MSRHREGGGHGKPRAAPGRPRVRRRATLAVVVVLVAAAGMVAWLTWPSVTAEGGVPRLVVEQPEVDLGYRRYESPVRAVFTLTNAGDGPLRLVETPRVRAVAGC
ncbi:MAG: hypothetical protein HY002_11045 [Candidatus Rokubacteria bacterium]|nr:hypothetical protein [Candidatus Rokubacteria bacterium]